MAALKEGQNVVIFPEDATKGYLAELEGFFQGFVMLAEVCHRRGMDVPIFVTYFKKKDLVYMVDAPVMYSELIKDGATREQIAQRLLDRCNELGRMDHDALIKKQMESIERIEEHSEEEELPAKAAV